MKMFASTGLPFRLAGGVVSLALAAGLASSAQVKTAQEESHAVESAQSRAQLAADEMVSLSADKIIQLLSQETGLLLEVKKVLVRKAYEQGRLLDPQDLTDEALFRLIREDENVRVFITREIEDRAYIRAKPTKEEIERGIAVPSRNQLPKETQSPDQVRPNQSQEEKYWATHQGIEEVAPLQNLQQNQVGEPNYQSLPDNQSVPNNQQQLPQGYPGTYPAQPGPQPEIPGVEGPARQLERTSLTPEEGDYPESPLGDSGQLPRVSPDEMPQLLAANSSVDGTAPLSGSRAGKTMNGLSAGSPDNGAAFDLPSSRQQPYPQDARQQIPRQRRTPIPSFERPPAQTALRHRPNPYADVPSLYDLYSQYSGRPAKLERFGAEIYRNGTGNFDQLPMDLPAGMDYVLGPGDGLSIDLWGGISERLMRVVDREGRVALPEVGMLEVSGKNLGDVQREVQKTLRTQYRDVQADVSLSRLRSVRVYVVGDVLRPGPYDISALSTPLNAVYTAGGPTTNGSLRLIRHYRGQQLVQETDVYDLLLHGVRSDLQGLQPGDTLLVPPLGAEVTVEGMVRRPAIYELNGEKNLSETLELAGGVLQSGTLRHVDVERVEAHLSRTMLRLDIPEDNNQAVVNKTLDDFPIQDGDKVKISPILPYADKTVYLTGHVFRPGKFAYRDGMKLTDVIHSYSDLLPEPYKQHAEIIRLNPPDYTPQVLAFNLDDALAGKLQDLALKPFDTVRVFGRFDFEDAPVVTVNGEVRDPGDHITNGVTYLRDAIYLAGGATQEAALGDAQVFRKTDDGKLEVLSVNLGQALAGNAADNILLTSKDRIFIHRNLQRTDPPTVEIQGEVGRPGKYPLGENLTAVGLVHLAGGLKRSAYTEQADLMRYPIENGTKVVGEHVTVPLAAALASQPDTDVRLHEGDVLTVRQLGGWSDIGATIQVKGEVAHPGTYGIQDGERLSSILARAGGLRSDAYPYGAVFERVQVRELAEHNRAELVRTVEEEGPAIKAEPDTDPDQKAAKEAALLQWQTTMERLKNTPPEGRMVIHISRDPKRWRNTAADVQVRAGDTIYIPKVPSSVMVNGSVYNPTAVAYKPGRSASWYLGQAGGPNNTAYKRGIFVIRADGSVAGGAGGLFGGGVGTAELRPGDMVVVPEKAFSANTRWKNILEGSQVAYAVGIAIQVARSF